MYPDPLIESHDLDKVLTKACEFVRYVKTKSALVYQIVSREKGHWYHEKSRVVAIVNWNSTKQIPTIDWHTDRKSAERYEVRYCL